MILQRIKQYIDHKGISVAAFERSISMSNASFGKSLKTGGAIGSDKLENILNIYKDLSPTWLLTGDGDMILDRNSLEATYSNVNSGIPLIPVEAMAGFLSGEVSVLESDCERLNIPGLKADFVIPVSGDSMEPKYYSGDYVACQNVNPGSERPVIPFMLSVKKPEYLKTASMPRFITSELTRAAVAAGVA